MKLFGSGLLVAFLMSFAIAATPVTAPNAEKTRALLALIRSSADLAVRADALRQLRMVATADAAPQVALLLADEKLGYYARDVLEGISDPIANEVMRKALDRLQGRALVGVVNSLGVRRDEHAVEPLGRLARDQNSPAAGAACIALGRIATPPALHILRQALTDAGETRAAAAEGCLLAAEQRSQSNARPAAQELYDLVRVQADLPLPLRVAATRGAILLGGESGGMPLLIENLHSPEPEFCDMALMCSRELPGSGLTRALVSELEKLPAAIQAKVVAALVDRRDEGALAAFEKYATTGRGVVRAAALRALGTMGGASSVPILLRATASADTAPNALRSLATIPAPQADASILEALTTADSALRVRLIGVLGERKAAGATPNLIAFASEADPAVRDAALRALGHIASPSDLPRLIELALAIDDNAAKTLADRAVVTTSMKVLEPERRAEAVLTAFRQATEPERQSALLRPLGAIVRAMGGSHEALFAIRPALQAPALQVRKAALRTLADWPDSAAASTLIEFAQQKGTTPAEREVALRGAMRMATNVAAGRDRSPLNVVDTFTQAARVAQTFDDKRLVVASLGSLKNPAAVTLLRDYLDDPALRSDAALALVQVAAGLDGANDPALTPLLARIAESEKDEDIRKKAGRLAKGLPVGPKKQAKAAGPKKALNASEPPAFFNGVDLGNWDGDPGVWRVRDGVIIGGSMEGNPRNEFLATRRSYRNFRLQLEYKIVGTEGFINGGVQFRSVRISQPPNEMSGYQADIGHGHSGSLYDESRRRKFLARADADQVKRLERVGDWNRYEIRCDGPRIELFLNGEKTLTYVEEDASVSLEGMIALQIHGKCKAEISFRNLSMEELP